MLATEKDDDLRLLRLLTTPHIGILLGAMLSCIAWALPAASEAGKGFVARPASSAELIWTITAYLGIAAASAGGFYWGLSLSKQLPEFSSRHGARLRQTGVWTCWILLSLVGVACSLVKVAGALGISGCIRTVATFNANGLKAALYTDYSMGILSLRYIVILAAGIAIFRYLAFREVSLRTIASLGLLMIVAVMSSRLSLIWAIVIGVTTYVLGQGDFTKRKIPAREVLTFVGVFIVLVGALTISRTYGYYRDRGAETFTAAIGTEFQRYLAAPFQGSIDAVNYPDRRARLQQIAGIDEGLTTNSAFLEMAVMMGKWNVLSLGAVLFWSGLVCGVLHRFRSSYFIVLFGVLQSCHLEIWRIVMFPKGITFTLVFASIVVPLFFSAFTLPAIRIPKVSIRLS